MPRFKNPGAAESFRAKVADRVKERRIYAAEKVAEVLPGPREPAKPKREVFAEATAVAVADGLADEPFFKGDPERFHTYLRNNWSEIRHQSEEEGVFIEYGHGLPGIRRSGKVGLRKTAEWSASHLARQADLHNQMVDNAKNVVSLPAVQLKLLPGA